MNIYTRNLILLIASVLLSLPALADDSYQKVKESVQRLSPGISNIAVSETPIPGLLEVQIESEIVYLSEDGKYLLQGRLFDLETREDLTDAAKSDIRKDLLKKIDASKQIVFSPANPDYDLIVFTDIDCGYCRKLHNEIDKYNEEGIAIHYMAFPRAGIDSGSYKKYVSVWCADDQKKAITEAKTGTDPEPKTCENPVREQYEAGLELGVSGTPALVTMDGKMIPGYIPPKQLRQRLDAMYKSSD